MIRFTDSEIKSLQENPDGLRALANWHDAQETMADAIGPELAETVRYHSERAHALRAEADRIEAEY